MKSLILLLSLIIASCNYKNESEKRGSNTGEVSLIIQNSEVEKAILKYIDELAYVDKKIITLSILRVKDRAVLRLSYITANNMLLYDIPDDYFYLGDNLILLYTGLNYISNPEKSYLNRLESVAKNKLREDYDLSLLGTKGDFFSSKTFNPKEMEIIIYKDLSVEIIDDYTKFIFYKEPIKFEIDSLVRE